jgi:hypothetical protein
LVEAVLIRPKDNTDLFLRQRQRIAYIQILSRRRLISSRYVGSQRPLLNLLLGTETPEIEKMGSVLMDLISVMFQGPLLHSKTRGS